MGAQRKKTAPAGPTRRKVLVTALATAAGVAGARILGLRNLDASGTLPNAMDAPALSMATGMAEPPAGNNPTFAVPGAATIGVALGVAARERERFGQAERERLHEAEPHRGRVDVDARASNDADRAAEHHRGAKHGCGRSEREPDRTGGDDEHDLDQH